MSPTIRKRRCDSTKPVKVTGTITKVEWLNPHVWFYVDVKDAAGKVTTWGFSNAPPGALMRRGITKDALKIGAEVTVEGVRARDGSNNASGRARDLRRRHERLYGNGGRKMSRRWIASAALAAALVFTGGRQMSAQDVPRMANGKPDFSGMYTPPSTVKGTGPRGNLIFNADKMAPVKPGAESLLYRPRTGDARLDEPRAMCLPAGFPSGMLYILPIQIVQNPKHIVIIPELQRAARIIPTDGRAHRARDRAFVLRRFSRQVGRRHTRHRDRQLQAVDPGRLPLHGSDQEPLAHRCASHHRASDAQGKQAQYRITIDDPKIFTRPFSQDFELTLRPDWETLGLLEYVCEENNRCAGGNCRSSGTP